MTRSRFDNLSGRRILLIQTAFPGDVLFSLPLAVALKGKFPGIRLVGLTSKEAAEVWKGQPCFDEMVVWDKRGSERGPLHVLRMGRLLRKFDFDIVLAAHASFATALLAWLSAAPTRVGFRVGPGATLLTRALGFPLHTFEGRYQEFFTLLALAPSEGGKVFSVNENVKAGVRRMLSETHWFDSEKRIALAFGSKIPTKKWPANRWADLLSKLAAKGSTKFALIGTAAEREEAERIRAGAPENSLNMTGLSVMESAAILQFSALVIGVDSFGLHLARFLGVPSLGIFGPTDPRALDWKSNQAPVHVDGLVCRPCTVFHAPRQCPKGHHDCMNRLPPESVVEAVRRFL